MIHRKKLLCSILCLFLVIYIFASLLVPPCSIDKFSNYSSTEIEIPSIKNSYIPFDELLPQSAYDTIRLIDIKHGFAYFLIWKNHSISWIEVDLYGSGVNKEVLLDNYDYYISSFKLNESIFSIFGQMEETGELNIVIVNPIKAATIATFPSHKLPFCAIANETLFLTSYKPNFGDTIYSFDGTKLKEIYHTVNSLNNQGEYSGELITAFGSANDKIYMQISTPNKQTLSEADTVLKVSDSNFSEINEYHSSEVYSFLGGGNLLFASVYGYPSPITESGRIINFQTFTQNSLTFIQSGNDIIHAGRWDCFDYLSTANSIVLFTANGNYHRFPSNKGVYSIVASDNYLVWQDIDGLQFLLHNQPTWHEQFNHDEQSKLSWRLTTPSIYPLVQHEDSLYYYEISNHAHLPLQLNDLVVWKYDSKLQYSTEIGSFSCIFFTVTVESSTKEIIFSADNEIYIFPF